jgi:purine-cytosine permease-like protein
VVDVGLGERHSIDFIPRDERHGSAWHQRRLLAYGIGFMAMIPFFSTAIFAGSVAKAAGGADLSIFVGLIVAGVLYYWFSRSIDVAVERRLRESEDVGLGISQSGT